MSFFQARHAVYVAFAVHIAAAEPPCYLARDPAYNSVRPFMGPARVYDAIKVALSTPQTIAGGDFHHPFGPSLRNVGEMGFCCLPSMMHQGLNDPVLAVESAAFGGAWQYFAGGRFGPLRGRPMSPFRCRPNPNPLRARQDETCARTADDWGLKGNLAVRGIGRA